MAQSTDVMYIYHLPHSERRDLCRILDQNNKWEELGGTYMKYDLLTMQVCICLSPQKKKADFKCNLIVGFTKGNLQRQLTIRRIINNVGPSKSHSFRIIYIIK